LTGINERKAKGRFQFSWLELDVGGAEAWIMGEKLGIAEETTKDEAEQAGGIRGEEFSMGPASSSEPSPPPAIATLR